MIANRILQINNLQEAEEELKKVNVSSGGIELMAPKAIGTAIKLNDVKLGAANILKQEMLSLGGDAAVAKGVVEGKVEISDVILLGNISKIRKLIRKLEYQSIFGLSAIRSELESLISNYTDFKPHILDLNGKKLVLDETRIMGVLNVTPDSFSDGSDFLDGSTAYNRALEMIEEGADIIDIGGESTRPGAQKISVKEELDRIIPVLSRLKDNTDIPISVDTTKSEVADQALKHGADMVNDISALRSDDNMINLLSEYANVPVVLMHMQGTPETMQKAPYYEDVISEILEFLNERIEYCLKHGVKKQRILLDPGIGFGKRQEDNLEILHRLSEFKCLGCPVVMGASRKSFIGRIYRSEAKDRLSGSLAAVVSAFKFGIEIVRVHDVLEHKRFLQTLQAIG